MLISDYIYPFILTIVFDTNKITLTDHIFAVVRCAMPLFCAVQLTARCIASESNSIMHYKLFYYFV